MSAESEGENIGGEDLEKKVLEDPSIENMEGEEREEDPFERSLRQNLLRPKQREEHVALVVCFRSGYKTIVEKLDWLEKNVFPKEEYPNRRLILFQDGGKVQLKYLKSNEWESYVEWEDLYVKLITGGFFRALNQRKKVHFDFGMFISIRKDDSEPGMGYGREECRDERCILRAVLLASKGNALFGDWGVPGEMRDPTVPDERIIAQYDLNPYYYIDTWNRTVRMYNGQKIHQGCGQPFLKVLDHFFRPIFSDNMQLPEELMLKIRLGVDGSLFTEKRLKSTRWNAWWDLYFARDGIYVDHHRWKSCEEFQCAGLTIHRHLRKWLASSTWIELFTDGFLFYMISFLFSLACLVMTLGLSIVQDCFVHLRIPSMEMMIPFTPSPLEVISTFFVLGPLELLIWYYVVSVIYSPIGIPPQNDRYTSRARIIEFFWFNLRTSLARSIVMIFFLVIETTIILACEYWNRSAWTLFVVYPVFFACFWYLGRLYLQKMHHIERQRIVAGILDVFYLGLGWMLFPTVIVAPLFSAWFLAIIVLVASKLGDRMIKIFQYGEFLRDDGTMHTTEWNSNVLRCTWVVIPVARIDYLLFLDTALESLGILMLIQFGKWLKSLEFSQFIFQQVHSRRIHPFLVTFLAMICVSIFVLFSAFRTQLRIRKPLKTRVEESLTIADSPLLARLSDSSTSKILYQNAEVVKDKGSPVQLSHKQVYEDYTAVKGVAQRASNEENFVSAVVETSENAPRLQKALKEYKDILQIQGWHVGEGIRRMNGTSFHPEVMLFEPEDALKRIKIGYSENPKMNTMSAECTRKSSKTTTESEKTSSATMSVKDPYVQAGIIILVVLVVGTLFGAFNHKLSLR